MTFNIEELLNQGMSLDDIATAFTSEINAASKQLEAKAAEAEKQKKFLTILDAIYQWIYQYFPNIVKDLGEDNRDAVYDVIYTIFDKYLKNVEKILAHEVQGDKNKNQDTMSDDKDRKIVIDTKDIGTIESMNLDQLLELYDSFFKDNDI